MGHFDKIHTAEDFLKAVDEKRNIKPEKETDESLFLDITDSVVEALSFLMKKLMKNGFTRREALRFVEAHQDFIYSMTKEEFLAQKHEEHLDRVEAYEDSFSNDDDEEDDLTT